jgi:hypothetical protein
MRATMTRATLVLVLVFASFATPIARAQDLMPNTFQVAKARTTRQRVLIGGLGAGALVVAGIGALFHLDSKHKADEISASGAHTGRVYTDDVDETRRDGLRSRAITIGAYGLAGGLVAAALVTFIVTDPGTETITVDDGGTARLSIDPLPGGAVASPGWRF